MDDVAAREVPVYFEVEEEIISAPSKVVHRMRIASTPYVPLVPSCGRVKICSSLRVGLGS